MEMSNRSSRVIPAVAGLVVASAIVMPAQSRSGGDRISLFQQLVRAGFPELAEQDLLASVTLRTRFNAPDWTAGDIIMMSAWPPRPESSDPPGTDPETAFLTAYCRLVDPGPHFREVVFNGTHVNSRKIRLFAEQARANPGWTDADVQEALKRAGAKYGPADREALLRDLNLERFAPILGELDRSKTRFLWRLGLRPGNPRDVMTRPGWSVELQARHPTRGHICYGLVFDPFDGRLGVVQGAPCAVPEDAEHPQVAKSY
jgi:hypothetical protein